GFAQLVLGVAAWSALADFLVLGADLAGVIALGAEAPAVGLGHLVAFLVVELHVVDLLDGTAREARLVRNQCLERGFRGDFVVAAHGLVPGPVGPGPHGMDARQAADVARHDAVGGEQEAGQGDDAAVLGLGGIGGIAPKRV